MATTSRARRAFAELVRRPDEEIDLLQGALLIAAEEYPELHFQQVHDRIDDLAERVQRVLREAAGVASGGVDGLLSDVFGPKPSRSEVIGAINRVLFEEEGFSGNAQHYDDPRNSFINEVLDQRSGIPITLALLYIEVARRAGYTLLGIGMPGHFIVGFPPSTDPIARDGARMIYIDAFNGGAVMSLNDCRSYFHRLYGREFPFSRDVLAPITNHQILTRMLNNLKGVYLQRGDYLRALGVVERLLLLEPAAVWELKLRGMLYYRLGSFVLARADLRNYIRRVPAGDDTQLLEYYVEFLGRLMVAAN